MQIPTETKYLAWQSCIPLHAVCSRRIASGSKSVDRGAARRLLQTAAHVENAVRCCAPGPDGDAGAEVNSTDLDTDRPEESATPVINGTAAPAGKWPDAVAVLSATGSCTGTLIAPDVRAHRRFTAPTPRRPR